MTPPGRNWVEQMNWEEFENALSWFKSAPSRWVASGKKDLSAMAEWILGVLEGDFAEETSLGQAAVGTVIGMIPGVGQITDVRDIVANGLKIKSEPSNKWHWFAMLLCLIALFPTLGGLVKGSFKVLFAYGRRGVFAAGFHALDSGLWKATEPFVEAGLRKLADFLTRPEVRKALVALKIDNPYKYLAQMMRDLSNTVSVVKLLKAFDGAMDVLVSFIGMVQRWGTAAMKTRAGKLLEDLHGVRAQADSKLGEVLKPAQDWLNRLAQRLDVEWRLKYGANVNVPNPHGYLSVSELDELGQAQKAKPAWIDLAVKPKYKALDISPAIPAGWPDIGPNGPKGLTDAFETFHDIKPVELPPGTVIYRVLAPKSYDNSICWMLEEEFRKLRSKADWRRRLAVLLNWNVNGEYLTYTVPRGPKGEGLRVWQGRAASQPLRAKSVVQKNAAGEAYWLEGGGDQIVLDGKALDPKLASARKPTGWGYDEINIQANLIGVPILQNQWRP